jgi:hypothetical protein
LPDGIKLSVLELDEPLSCLEEPRQVRLSRLEKSLKASDLSLEHLGQTLCFLGQFAGLVPIGDGGFDLGNGPLLDLLECDARPVIFGLSLADERAPLLNTGMGVT